VGACALAVSAYTAILQRQQVRAQIWPVVTWDTDTDLADDSTNERFAVRLTNSGVGPAFIKWAALTVDGSPVATWTDLIERFHGKKGFSAHLSRTALTNLVLGAGQDHRVFAVDGVVASEIAPAALRLQFSVCYCSVLEECWQVDSAQATPQAVRACAKPPVPFIGE
jgi:hypothetical protein